MRKIERGQRGVANQSVRNQINAHRSQWVVARVETRQGLVFREQQCDALAARPREAIVRNGQAGQRHVVQQRPAQVNHAPIRDRIVIEHQ